MVQREADAQGSPVKAKERVLIFEVNWLGDVLFSTPAIRAVRQRFPGAYIVALAVPRCKPILAGNNYIDEIMVLDEERRHKGFLGKMRLVRDLRVRRFTDAYFLKSSLTRVWCVWLAGVKRRVGYAGRKGAFLLTERVALPPGPLHRADTYYYLVAKAAIPASERYLDFFVPSEDDAIVEGLLKYNSLGQGRKLVVMHVGGNWGLKRWPARSFSELIDAIRSSYGADVVISGSYREGALAQEIAGRAAHKPFVACGLLSLKQLGALFKRCDLVVSADSGPLHIATAVQARTLSLFGPTSPEITGPIGRGDFAVLRSPKNIPCVIPCYEPSCPNNVCMSFISVAQILEEIDRRGWLTRTP
jgi:lipopolysaccharide heptosyltransferase II